MSEASSFTQAGRAIGAMFYAFFGAGWLTWWCLQAYGAAPGILALIVAGGAALFILALRQFRRHRSALATQASTPAGKQIRRRFTIVNVIQWLAIVVAANLLANFGQSEWIAAAVILIVGLHFIPLAAIFKNRSHYLTGSALILLSVTYPFVSGIGAASPVGLLGTGMILWGSALGALMGSSAGNGLRAAPPDNAK